MQLDHFVIHVENDLKPLDKLASQIQSIGFPFKPKKGKGTAGFKVSNIWVGDQYFEIVRLLKSDGGGWPREWVERVNNGERGVSCIFIQTNNLDAFYERLKINGVECSVEKTRFRALFGLMTVEMPWRYIKLPPIPGTHVDIRFIQYDPASWDHYRKYMKPNSRDLGVKGIFEAQIHVPSLASSINYLRKLFPSIEVLENSAVVNLTPGKITFLELQTDSSVVLFANTENPTGQSWRLLDLEVRA